MIGLTSGETVRLEFLKMDSKSNREREYPCLKSPVIQMLIRLDFYMIPQEVIGDYLSEIMAMSGFKIVKPISMDDM